VVGVDDGAAVAGGDGEGEAGQVAVEGGVRVPPRGPHEEALDAGEGGVRGGGGRGVAADEARVVGEGDGGGGLALGLGVEEHVDAPLPRRRRHQGVVADVEADHAHRRRRFGIRSARMGRKAGGRAIWGRGGWRWRWRWSCEGERCAGGYGPRTPRWAGCWARSEPARPCLLACRRQVGPLLFACPFSLGSSLILRC